MYTAIFPLQCGADHIWVLSLPKRLRGFLQRDATLAGKVLRIMLEEVERELRGHCPAAGAKARTGAVAFPHRFGTSLNGHMTVSLPCLRDRRRL